MGKLSVKLGRQGEERAVRFLQQLGYQILQRTFRGGGGELDIVCRKDGIIYFVEVKYRGEDAWFSPVEAVTAGKRRRLYQAAQAWLYQKLGREEACSFLLLAMSADGRIELIEDYLLW